MLKFEKGSSGSQRVFVSAIATYFLRGEAYATLDKIEEFISLILNKSASRSMSRMITISAFSTFRFSSDNSEP